jgi:Chaperone of endosialidase
MTSRRKIRQRSDKQLKLNFMKHRSIILGLACFALCRMVQAVVPAPDGGYPGGNTAEGQNALFSLTTGGYNTAVGLFSLRSNTDGTLNTATGAGTLLANIADENTATGAGALLRNTTGGFNTATGAFALASNTDGYYNTAMGVSALQNNTTGNRNAAMGNDALHSNTTGASNTAFGWGAMASSTTANSNTASGYQALVNNTTGNANTANGLDALQLNTTGFNNVALGFNAGSNQTTGSNNVYIGANVTGVAGESNACYIRNIFGALSASGMPVLVNIDNKLGTTTSSKRFKEEIKPMDKTSEALLSLKPVTFRYKKEIDPAGTSQFGLVAEEVEKVSPDLVVHDKKGKPYSVRYEQVNAMLLNEFLKEHKTVEELKSTVAKQEKQIQALTSAFQKVTAQIEEYVPHPKVVLKDP